MKKKKRNTKTNILCLLAQGLFLFQRIFTRMKVINYPSEHPCLFALWHAHQCAVWSIRDHKKMYALVSNSNDGQIVASASNAVGIQTIRGSQKRHGTQATMQILEKIEQNNSIAITIDGPKGPNHVVKDGIIAIAKLAQVPIVPFVWYCPSPLWLKFNTWDEFRFAIFACRTIVLYGEPIYVPEQLSDEEKEYYRLKVENDLKALYEDAKTNYKKYVNQKSD